MTTPASPPPPRAPRRALPLWLWPALIVFFGLLGVGVALLLTNIQQRHDEAAQPPAQFVAVKEFETDPAVWGKNFPHQYNSFMKTKEDSGRTPYAGSTPFDKLAQNPFRHTAWAGYPFDAEYNEERGHYWSLDDQKFIKRVKDFDQPGTCANCHAGDVPRLIAEMGWDKMNQTPYKELEKNLHSAVSCGDCHSNKDMSLTITRPAFVTAMAARGFDVKEATHQQMRTYVCAQCHVEYYFEKDTKALVFPWSESKNLEAGITVEDMENYYAKDGHTDWEHKITGGRMIKMQHPDYETYSTGIHAKNGVACADCHMPYTREGAQKVSDHWVRSPLKNINNACQTCHKVPEAELRDRVVTIQNRTNDIKMSAEAAITDAVKAIKAAKDAGATKAQLDQAYTLHRRSQLRWDYVDAESSMGFHSPQEATRTLGHSADLARQAQIEATRVLASLKTPTQ
ncbi:nitrite reductase (cytochrome c-552) [Deinococcus reticulitermitis]|uniref:nitrite reductase (cytochrome; ammonia-forming) n=1 Tax=Deinococcus reticulitermitis TaxID=856736 RepID=A0A1H7BJ45_9DEIO|nr:ammonia-forming cytochrome c nitrite reductase subunit c552 [Deinococcus reticulitermitis]SEJ73425.1 nitrite reductase (cytochrome c-552) [Deinococcus reticulitermitis]